MSTPKRKWPTLLFAGLLLVALVLGFAYFAGMNAPESYPKMSSLNAGPNGAKLLFDSLNSIAPLAVSRNFLPSSQWHPSATTILLLAMFPERLNSADKNDLAEMERLTKANDRVVLCISDNASAAKPDPKKPALIKTRWGIQILPNAKKDADQRLILDYDGSWQPVDGLDDAVEKHFAGGGSVLMALHSEDFSNENLATDNTVLDEIPPLIGNHTSVVFDETHLGIEEAGSIAGLARRYKLEGLVAGLLILVGLFIWNQSVSFPPPSRYAARQDAQVAGADARGMFAALIARHLTPQVLLESCVTEWNRLKPRQRLALELPAKLDPVSAYRRLQETLRAKRTRL